MENLRTKNNFNLCKNIPFITFFENVVVHTHLENTVLIQKKFPSLLLSIQENSNEIAIMLIIVHVLVLRYIFRGQKCLK